MASNSNGRNASFGKQCQKYLPLVGEATFYTTYFYVFFFYKITPDFIN